MEIIQMELYISKENRRNSVCIGVIIYCRKDEIISLPHVANIEFIWTLFKPKSWCDYYDKQCMWTCT